MKALRQVVVYLVVIAAGLYIWVAFVPAAQPLLQRLGVLDLLGIEVAQSDATEGQGGRRGDGATRVITDKVTEQALADRITAIGDGRAKRSVTVRSNAVGVITSMPLTAGSTVKAGTVIAKLQAEAEEIALAQARITLDEARNDVERIKQLETTGAVTEVRLRETQVALSSAELAVRQAEFDLSQREVTAPISGQIGFIEVEEGDRVNAQDILATITDRSDILIDFRVPERVVGRISEGQTIEVTPLGLRDKVMIGEINVIDTVLDRDSRTLLVQGLVPNDDDLLRAGMAFSVVLTLPGETLLSIAPLAVQWSSDGPFVWAVRDGQAAQVDVTIAKRNADTVLVRSDGLKAGETVVTEGVQMLRDGAAVEPVNLEGTASQSADDGPKETL